MQIPEAKPRLSYSELLLQVQAAGLDTANHPLFIAGIRGYYAKSLGTTAANERGIYDDAIFLVSSNFFGSYNANTDPSVVRPGVGTGAQKGMACLKPGVWRSYRFGIHKTYEAIIQTGGEVTVMRDAAGGGAYADTGYFGVNIHRGGYGTTSSLGCQTIYPKQWDGFIASAQDQARRHFGTAWRRTTIPYVLIDPAAD